MHTTTADITFWVLLLICMAFFAALFIWGTANYDELCTEDGVGETNFTYIIVGIASLGLPAIEAGIWLHYSAATAWAVLVVECLWAISLLLKTSRDA